MLFVLDASVLSIDPKCNFNNRALETLLGAYQSREHLLFMEMPDLLRLVELAGPHLSSSSRSVLTSLYNKLPEYGGILNVVDYKVIVYHSDDAKAGMYKQEESWFVPLRYFAGSGLISSAVLGENELDSELYLQLAEHFIAKEKIRGFRAFGRMKSGGGSGTPKTLTAYMRGEYSPCICITDSDKLHPAYKKSATVKNCGLAARARNRVVEHVALEERELENLIPQELIGKIVDINDFSREMRNAGVDSPDHWKYLDLKNGISLGWLLKQNEPTREFWRSAETYLGRKKRACVFCRDLEDADKDNCDCGKVGGLGVKLLESVVNYLAFNEPRVNLRLLSDDMRWQRIGKIVFDFTVAPVGELVAN